MTMQLLEANQSRWQANAIEIAAWLHSNPDASILTRRKRKRPGREKDEKQKETLPTVFKSVLENALHWNEVTVVFDRENRLLNGACKIFLTAEGGVETSQHPG